MASRWVANSLPYKLPTFSRPHKLCVGALPQLLPLPLIDERMPYGIRIPGGSSLILNSFINHFWKQSNEILLEKISNTQEGFMQTVFFEAS